VSPRRFGCATTTSPGRAGNPGNQVPEEPAGPLPCHRGGPRSNATCSNGVRRPWPASAGSHRSALFGLLAAGARIAVCWRCHVRNAERPGH
jgi:hypothetical protein